jgi:glycosyltransferase involved in cell wall biosynthesis
MDERDIIRSDRKRALEPDRISRIMLSVIICSHNPNKGYLTRVLFSLRSQTLSTESWELLIVDNASSTRISDFADISWHPLGRHISEPELGLAAARVRGIEEAKGKVLVFVDDDNVLALDYLSTVVEIESGYPFLGAWGSASISLECEIQPGEHLKELLPWLGFRCSDKAIWSNSILCGEATPIGAGLCARDVAARAYVEFYKASSIKISGRRGSALGGHEDFELCYVGCKIGLGMGVFPQLSLTHLINEGRVTDDHIVKLIEDGTRSKLILLHKWGNGLPRSPFSMHGAASFALNLFTRRGFDRRVYFAELRAVFGARHYVDSLSQAPRA